jgi:hypothetical protein
MIQETKMIRVAETIRIPPRPAIKRGMTAIPPAERAMTGRMTEILRTGGAMTGRMTVIRGAGIRKNAFPA